jgi:5-methylcytosine-specific restriction endonuclease McrA
MRGKDLTGNRYGKLVATRKTKKRSSSGNLIWLLRCDCGKDVERATSTLTKDTKSCCGCSKYSDITNSRFSRLVAVEKIDEVYHRSPIWECLCDCGNVVNVPINRLKSGHTKSCGCLHRDKTIERSTGENNFNWNPSLTKEDRIKRRMLPEYQKWRTSVYERDSHTCQKCKKLGGNINAHHKDGYHWCKERRIDLDNGITLCEDCHNSFHSQYGNKYNTEAQIKEFLNE